MRWPDLSQRSQAQELLDAPDLCREELWRNLEELALINRWLGGHRVTLQGLERLLSDRQRLWRIVDIGCGGGDTLYALAHWARCRGLHLELTGVDLKPECLEFARQTCVGLEIEWVCSDYRRLSGDYDIILTSLFCHHLDSVSLHEFLCWARNRVRVALLINDLHRHPLAWAGIRLLTGLCSRSRLVRHDAPLSVWRGFSRQELAQLLLATGWQAELEWCWAFRWRVLAYV